jgi:hypothetical protein
VCSQEVSISTEQPYLSKIQTSKRRRFRENPVIVCYQPATFFCHIWAIIKELKNYYEMSHQVSFLLLYFGTLGLHESTPEGPSFCLELSVQVFHTISASLFIVHVQLLLDVPLLRCPWGFQSKACFCVAE